MGLKADDLREGFTIAVHCLGGTDQDQFLQGLPGGDARLTASLDDAGAQWRVHPTTNPGIFSFECAGTNGFLEGRPTIHSLPHHPNPPGDIVRLVQGIEDPFTSWKVMDLPDVGGAFDHVMLQNQEDLNFLTGQPNIGSVRLLSENSADLVTHWELILLPVGRGGGPSSGGDKPH